MTIRKRTWKTASGEKKVSWMIDVRHTKPTGEEVRIRKTAPGTTRRDAEAYEREVIASLINGSFGSHEEREVPTFKDFTEEWFNTYVKVENKPSVQRTRKSVLNARLIPFFGDRDLDQIDSRLIDAYKAEALGSVTRTTVNKHIGVLSSMLSTAKRWGILTSVPHIKWLTQRQADWDFLDFDETDRFVASAKEEPEWAAFFETAVKTGMRLGELCALRWTDVDLIKAQIRVSRSATRRKEGATKTNQTRTIAMPDSLVVTLTKHRQKSALRGTLVFSSPTGEMLARDNSKHALKRICRHAGLRLIGHHTLRHTYASHLVMLGVPLKAVQELLGHSSLEMTMRYAHLAPGLKQEVVKVLDDGERLDLNRANAMRGLALVSEE